MNPRRALRALSRLRGLWVGAALALFACSAAAHDQLGANLNGIRDYVRDHAFVDLVKQSRLFLKIGQWDDGPVANRAPLNAQGWPTGDFRLVAMVSQRDTLNLAGAYTVVFQGQATLAVPGGASGSLSAKTYDPATDTTRATLQFPTGGDILAIDFSATGGTVRNLRVLRPGADPADAPLLRAAWKDHAGRFQVLRFMDWTRTNGNRERSWSERATPDKRRTEAYTASWETVIDTANALRRDAWVNVPVQADDDYVTRLATLLRDRLDPALNVYVEYGNELWNFSLRDDGMDAFHGGTAFNGATVNRDLAAAAPAGSPLRFDGTTDVYTLAFRRVGLRIAQISGIFRGVWGEAAINTRVRPVLAGQMANPYVVEQGLELIEEGLGVAPASVIYAIAGAPYVFASAAPDGEADETPGLTAQQILDGLAAGVANAPSDSDAYQYHRHARLAAWYGLEVLAYEAGFDTFGPNNVQSKRLANLDLRIRGLCRDYVNGWHAHGFGPLMWFLAGADDYDTPYGAWPLVEDLATPAVPKNQCMDDVLAAALPAVTVGLPVADGPIAGGAYAGSASPGGALGGGAAAFGYPGYVEYLLRAESAGRYSLVFSGSAPPGESFRVGLNDAVVAANVSLPADGGNSAAFTVDLRRGLNSLRIGRAVGSAWSLASFSLGLLGDASPDAFAFAPRSGVAKGSTVVSDPATITGIALPAAVGVSGGEYSVGCTGEFTSAPGSIANLQSVCLRHTAAAAAATSTTTTLTVGGVSASFTSTTAAASDPGGSSYRLNVSRAGDGAGSVKSSPAGIDCGSGCSASFAAGRTVTLSARAASGSLFTGWSGACSGLGGCRVTMNAERSVTANFARAATLTVSRKGSGRVMSSVPGVSCGGDCKETYLAGTELTLSATAAAGSVFTGWSGACSGTGVCSLSLGESRKVTATFKRELTLGVSLAGTGTGRVVSSPAGIDCGAGCSAIFLEGGSVTLTASAGPGSSFAGWSGACSGTRSTCTVSMRAARSVTANFSATAAATSGP